MSRTSSERPERRTKKAAKDRFTRSLLPWYEANKRPLPWRSSKDPYKVWLSEVILQQTRVEQGRAYWERFVGTWPTVRELAAATEDEVLKAWQGLGYYGRARNLRRTAQEVVARYNGRFPEDHSELIGLKGIGDYTASAISSICFGKPDAVVDGNVYRVLARVFGIDVPIDSTQGRKQFKTLAQELLDHDRPGDHNQAVMELGATVCTPKVPDCRACPVRVMCVAFAEERAASLPVKAKKSIARDRFFNYLVIRGAKGLRMHKRTGKDIWQGLWEPPLIETERACDERALLRTLERTLGKGWRIDAKSEEVRHVLSHQVIHAVFWTVTAPPRFTAPVDWEWADGLRMKRWAVPRLIERWITRAGV